MGHSYCDMLDTVIHGTIDESFHAGNERLATFKAEAFFVGILASNEFLEGLGPDKALTNPITLFFVRDVNILDSDSTTWYPVIQRTKDRGRKLTVYALKRFDYFSKAHS